MQDIEILMKNHPGTLALIGETLGENNISLEGGGVFEIGKTSIAHFLVQDAQKAKNVLEKVHIEVAKINTVLILKLRQDVPGQLGMFCRRLADANVNILTQYSDHSNQLIIVVDDYERGNEIVDSWMKEWWN